MRPQIGFQVCEFMLGEKIVVIYDASLSIFMK